MVIPNSVEFKVLCQNSKFYLALLCLVYSSKQLKGKQNEKT